MDIAVTYSVKGVVTVIARDKNGNIKYVYKDTNVVTNVGKAQLAGLLNGVVTTPFHYIAIGTDDGTQLALSASNTALGAEIARKAGTTGRKTTSVTNDTAVIEATFSSADGLTGSSAVAESGIFDASSGGNMFSRKTFPVVNMNWDNGDTLTIHWEIQIQ